MPGVPLNLSYPVVGEPIATALGKLLAILQALQADIEPKVTSAEFTWVGDQSASGHALTALSRLQLEDILSSVGVATGSVYFKLGDAYCMTASGEVRLTSGGAINAAGIGGIVGDYGGSNPARVTYTDLTDIYSFTADVGDYSELEVSGVRFRNTGNWLTLRADPATSSAITWSLSAAPGAGVSLLRQSSAGLVDAVTTISNATTFSANVNFTGAGKVTHGARTRLDLARGIGGVNYTNGIQGIVCTGNASPDIPVPGSQTWERVTGLRANVEKAIATTLTLTPMSVNATTGVTAAVGAGVSSAATGRFAMNLPLTTPAAHSDVIHYFIRVSGADTLANADRVYSTGLTYDSV